MDKTTMEIVAQNLGLVKKSEMEGEKEQSVGKKLGGNCKSVTTAASEHTMQKGRRR